MSGRAHGRLHAVILAGGSGERFWPLSRRTRPKPLLRIGSRRSLLETTLARARRFAPPSRTWVVCAADHARPVRRAARLPRGRVLVEPVGRNTALAVGYAAARIACEDPDAVLAVLPADHHVPDAAAFARAIRRAARAASQADRLVTLGVRPTRPETGYGYLELGPRVGAPFPGLHQVRRFVEKPARERARGFLRRGGFLWNSGVFVWKPATILAEIERWAPDVARALEPVRRRPRGAGSRRARELGYRRGPARSIDVAVLQRSRRVWTLPVDFRWSDVGTWASLAETLGRDGRGGKALAGQVLQEQAGGNLVWGGRRLVALLGVEGLAVIDSDDALLVMRLEHSSDVRRVVARLRERGRTDLL